jgi:hypothetical protein
MLQVSYTYKEDLVGQWSLWFEDHYGKGKSDITLLTFRVLCLMSGGVASSHTVCLSVCLMTGEFGAETTTYTSAVFVM